MNTKRRIRYLEAKNLPDIIFEVTFETLQEKEYSEDDIKGEFYMAVQNRCLDRGNFLLNIAIGTGITGLVDIDELLKSCIKSQKAKSYRSYVEKVKLDYSIFVKSRNRFFDIAEHVDRLERIPEILLKTVFEVLQEKEYSPGQMQFFLRVSSKLMEKDLNIFKIWSVDSRRRTEFFEICLKYQKEDYKNFIKKVKKDFSMFVRESKKL